MFRRLSLSLAKRTTPASRRSFGSKSGGAEGGAAAPPPSLQRRTLESLLAQNPSAVSGKSVLVRVDYNVPLSKKATPIAVSDETYVLLSTVVTHLTSDFRVSFSRIRESIPTLLALSKAGAKTVLASHLGRPAGTGFDPKLSLAPVAERLKQLLSKSGGGAGAVHTVNDCVGPAVTQAVTQQMKSGDFLLLENVRFHADEEKNAPDFARRLAVDTQAAVFVNDAFGAAHRAHASTSGVRQFISGPAVAGTLMAKELAFLQKVRDSPARPFVAVMGGAKVSDKITVIEALIQRSGLSTLVIGGGMAFPFLKAMGVGVGSSKCDDKQYVMRCEYWYFGI